MRVTTLLEQIEQINRDDVAAATEFGPLELSAGDRRARARVRGRANRGDGVPADRRVLQVRLWWKHCSVELEWCDPRRNAKLLAHPPVRDMVHAARNAIPRRASYRRKRPVVPADLAGWGTCGFGPWAWPVLLLGLLVGIGYQSAPLRTGTDVICQNRTETIPARLEESPALSFRASSYRVLPAVYAAIGWSTVSRLSPSWG